MTIESSGQKNVKYRVFHGFDFIFNSVFLIFLTQYIKKGLFTIKMKIGNLPGATLTSAKTKKLRIIFNMSKIILETRFFCTGPPPLPSELDGYFYKQYFSFNPPK